MAAYVQCRRARSSHRKSIRGPTDARSRGGGKSHEKCIPAILRSEGCRKYGSQRRNRSVHQSGQTGLHNLENKKPALRSLLVRLYVSRQFLFVQFLRTLFVLALFVNEIVEQLPDAGVLRTRPGLLVEPASLYFQGARFFANRFDA